MKILTVHRNIGDKRRLTLIKYLSKYADVDSYEIKFRRSFKVKNTVMSYNTNRYTWRETTKKNSRYFRYASDQLTNYIQKCKNDYDYIFFFEGLYTLNERNHEHKYVIYEDTNNNLTRKYWPKWNPPSSEHKTYIDYVYNMYHNSRHIFTATDMLKEDFVNNYGIEEKRVTNVGMGCNFDHIEEEFIRGNHSKILFVGYDEYRKGLDVLIEAFRCVKLKIDSAELIIVGTKKQYYRNGIRSLGKIIDREKLMELYKECAIFVMPSRYDAVPTSALEAFAMKMAVIVSDHCGAKELIEDGISGYIFQNEDYRDLESKITKLVENPAGCMEIGERGYHKSKIKNDWSKIASKIVNILDNDKI